MLPTPKSSEALETFVGLTRGGGVAQPDEATSPGRTWLTSNTLDLWLLCRLIPLSMCWESVLAAEVPVLLIVWPIAKCSRAPWLGVGVLAAPGAHPVGASL